jgi:CheY-like chemotaxis protein
MGVSVLVVDDDPANRHSVATLLGIDGHPADVAAHGREALNLLRAGCRPALILLDLMMPVMDGWAFLRQRRREAALAVIPVVVLSATGREEEAAVRTLGADAFLLKPVEPESLLNAVRRYG